MLYLNFVTVARLERNPTIKSEIQMRGFERDIPAGFLCFVIQYFKLTPHFSSNPVDAEMSVYSKYHRSVFTQTSFAKIVVIRDTDI
jgi:hypothetical protein